MSFPGLMAKVKTLNSKILTKDEIRKLLSAKDLQDVIKQLADNPKLSLSTERDLSKLHRRDIEILLRRKMIDDFYNIYFYLPVDGKKFFKFMERRFEIENIKHVLRVLHLKKPETIDETKFFPLKHPEIDPKSLLNVKTMEGLIKLLKDSYYYSIIESSYETYVKNNHIEMLLNSLDFWYFMSMKKVLKSLPGYGGGIKKIFYIQTDLTNIEWIYRSRILFGLDSHETLNYIIPIEGKLTKADFSKLASSNDLDNFIENLSLTPYGEYFRNISKDTFSYVFQRISYRVLLKYAKMLLSHTDNGLDVLGGYLYVREYEYMDIVSIIESKRYAIKKEESLDFLILGR